VVGLGNPGETYEKTRHNLGFMILDRLAERHGTKVDLKKKKSLVGRFRIEKERIVLLKPQTFVNLSGEAVLYMASFCRITPENIVVVCDDVNLPLGKIRIRSYGSSGGHNGIRSLIQFLRSDNFPRVRVGIGSPPEGVKLEDYVLGEFTPEEMSILKPTIEKACDAIELILTGKIEEAMNKYNG